MDNIQIPGRVKYGKKMADISSPSHIHPGSILSGAPRVYQDLFILSLSVRVDLKVFLHGSWTTQV